MDVKFDLQEFLRDMREEQKQDHEKLAGDVKVALEKLQDHHTRLVVVEKAYGAIKWVAGTTIVGFIAFIFDVLKNHLFVAPKP